jgi:hypothetical protein
VVTPVFAGVFGKNGRFYVVFWWWERGGLRGERGVLAACFLGLENAPRFRGLFFGVSRFGNAVGGRLLFFSGFPVSALELIGRPA